MAYKLRVSFVSSNEESAFSVSLIATFLLMEVRSKNLPSESLSSITACHNVYSQPKFVDSRVHTFYIMKYIIIAFFSLEEGVGDLIHVERTSQWLQPSVIAL